MFKAIYEFCFVTGKSVQNQEYPETKNKRTLSDLLFLLPLPLVHVLIRKYFWTLICLKAFNYVDQNFANALSNGYL